MSDYFFSNGINDNGGNIVLTAPWEHQKSELRCLAIATDKEHQELKVLNGDLILGSNGTYTITYPFETPGLPWAAYLWRETTQNGNPKYENGRIPVEAMLSKLSELSKKADETREFVKRAFMTPEDAEGKMFVPPLEVRKGRLLGFDNNGNPVTGDACPQIAELDEQQKVIEGLAKEARDRALEAANSVIRAAEYATNASNSANNAGRSAVSAGNYATNAKNWHDKTVSESAATLAKSELAAGRSELAERLARESSARAEQAMNEALLGLSDLNEKLCYVACAVGRAEKAVETVESRAEEAKTELTDKAEQTKQEIAGFTDVYKKSETYSKSQIDGVDTGAELTAAMNKAHEWLASVSGKLPPSLYESLLEMLRLWSLNPTSLDFTPYITEIDRALKDWQDDPAPTAWAYGDGSSPYEGVDIDTALVDFKVKSITGLNDNVSRPIGVNSSGIFILPSVEDLQIAFRNFTKIKLPAFTPKTKSLHQAYRFTTFDFPIYAPEATELYRVISENVKFNSDVFAPKATTIQDCFLGCRMLDRAFNFPCVTGASRAFNNTAMSPANVAKTLDSLPSDPKGKGGMGIISFSRYDGTLLAPLMAESPYKESVDAAVAKGWTVEL